MIIKRVIIGVVSFFYIICAPVTLCTDKNEVESAGGGGREGKTGYWQVRLDVSMMVLGTARYSEIHIRHHVLISGKLQYLATIWFWRCWISQIVLHTVSSMSLLSRVLMIYFTLSAVLFKKSIPDPFPWGAVGRTEWDQQNRGAASLHGYRKYNVWQL